MLLKDDIDGDCRESSVGGGICRGRESGWRESARRLHGGESLRRLRRGRCMGASFAFLFRVLGFNGNLGGFFLLVLDEKREYYIC